MKITPRQFGILTAASAILAFAPCARAAYVNFTGLNNTGGTFSGVGVGTLGGTGVNSPSTGDGMQMAGITDKQLFRFEQTSGYANNVTLIATFNFAQPLQTFSIEAFTANSNMNVNYDTITFQANGASGTFDWLYTVQNGSTGYTSGSSITMAPNSAQYLGFTLAGDEAISGFTVTLTSKSGATPYNSAQFKLDVVPEPSTTAMLAAAGFALLAYRSRNCRAVSSR